MSSAELHHVYDDYAPTYARNSADNAYNAYYERPASLALVGDVTGLRVLDAGCGPGGHAEALIAGGARLTGVDGSSGQLEQARQRLGPDVPLHQADLSKPLPLPDNAVDVVLASLVMHYIEDWHTTLTEFHRVLVPGGRFVMSTHHPFMDHAIAANDDYFAKHLWAEQWGEGHDAVLAPTAARDHGRPVLRRIPTRRAERADARSLGQGVVPEGLPLADHETAVPVPGNACALGGLDRQPQAELDEEPPSRCRGPALF